MIEKTRRRTSVSTVATARPHARLDARRRSSNGRIRSPKAYGADHVAENTIFLQCQKIIEYGRGTAERKALHAATEDLLSIKIHRLKWPDFRMKC
jgi:hypothetical protein